MDRIKNSSRSESPDSEFPDKANSEDLREKPRLTLVLRSAKLICAEGEFLCIVRDVSETGVRLRLFNELPEEQTLDLEIGSGERIALSPVWNSDGQAGFHGTEAIDVDRFIAETGPYPKRPVRIRVNHEVKLIFGETELDAQLGDISREGAQIETSAKLAVGQKLRISGPELREFEATVCWRRHPRYGLVFRQIMSLEELALRTSRMTTKQSEPETQNDFEN